MLIATESTIITKKQQPQGDSMLIKENEKNRKDCLNFIYPQYSSNCISNIPKMISQLFHVKNENLDSGTEKQVKKIDDQRINKKIVLLVIDGFGFNQFIKNYKENPFLTNLTNKGEVFPLTSTYPSQTTNALTTLNTGLTPQEHGLFEYFIYLKEVGIINSLRFEGVSKKNRGKLIEQGYDPTLMFNGENFSQVLGKEGIRTFTHMHISNAFNVGTELIFKGSTIVPSLKTSDSIVRLRKNLERSQEGTYFFVHLETLDTIAHQYGPESAEYKAELQSISYLLQRELVEKTNPKVAKETLIIMTADHGLVQVNPDKTTYLNIESDTMNLEYGKDRRKILPTGGPRDIFLHIKDHKLRQTKEALFKKIGKKAQILETKDAIQNGLFGLGQASDEFIERTGNLLILPYKNETIWFEGPQGRKIDFLGQHGGLSEEEMIVPFGVARLSDMK